MRRAAAALPLPSAQSLPRDDNDVKDGVHLARHDIMLAASADRLADAVADADTDADADTGRPHQDRAYVRRERRSLSRTAATAVAAAAAGRGGDGTS